MEEMCHLQHLLSHVLQRSCIKMVVIKPLCAWVRGPPWLVATARGCSWDRKPNHARRHKNTLGPKERQPLSLDWTTWPHEDVNSLLVNELMSKSIPIKASFVFRSGQDDFKVHKEKWTCENIWEDPEQDLPGIIRCVKSLQWKQHGTGARTDGQTDQEKDHKGHKASDDSSCSNHCEKTTLYKKWCRDHLLNI